MILVTNVPPLAEQQTCCVHIYLVASRVRQDHMSKSLDHNIRLMFSMQCMATPSRDMLSSPISTFIMLFVWTRPPPTPWLQSTTVPSWSGVWCPPPTHYEAASSSPETLLLLPLVTPYGSALILLLSLSSFLWYGSYLLSCIPYNNLSSSSMKRLNLWKLPESLSSLYRSCSWFPTPVSFTQASWSGILSLHL